MKSICSYPLRPHGSIYVMVPSTKTLIVLVSSTETPASGLILLWFHRLKLPPPDSYCFGFIDSNSRLRTHIPPDRRAVTWSAAAAGRKKRKSFPPCHLRQSGKKLCRGGGSCIFPQSTDMHGLPAANTKEIIHCPCAAGAKLYCTQCTA